MTTILGRNYFNASLEFSSLIEVWTAAADTGCWAGCLAGRQTLLQDVSVAYDHMASVSGFCSTGTTARTAHTAAVTAKQPAANRLRRASCRVAGQLLTCAFVVSACDCCCPRLLVLLVQEDHGSGPPSTRVACTIGPESNSVEALTSMLQTGMAVSRLWWSGSAQLQSGCCRLCENADS